MEQYFKEDEPHVYNRHDEDLIEQKYDEFIERIKGEIENWSAKGSGWEAEMIKTSCVRECRTLSATARRNLFTNSSQSGKKGYN